MRPRTIRAAVCLATFAALFPPVPGQTPPPDATPPAFDKSSPSEPAAQAQPAIADRPYASLPAQVGDLLSDPAVARDHWGIMVTALDGATIYAINETQLFQPASNVKLFTTAGALATLSPDTSWETRVVGDLDAKKGTVTGDLTLVGGGDPNLSGRSLPYIPPAQRSKDLSPPPDPLRYLADLADQLAAKGLKVVKGDIVGDDTLFPWEPYPSDWALDDAVWGYGAPVSALTINDNQLQLTIIPAVKALKPAILTISPTMPYYTVEMNVTTAAAKSGTHVQIERAPGSKTLRIYGAIAVDANPDKEEIAIQDPAEYAAAALKQLLEARGVTVTGGIRVQHWNFPDSRSFLEQTREPLDPRQLEPKSGYGCSISNGPTPPRGAVLATHTSAPLSEEVVVTNKVSQNLHAELLLHHLAQRLCFPTTAQGERLLRSFLTIDAGLDPNDFVFFDGSGLSSHDLVTPRATAALLKFAAAQSWGAAWKASLPIGGEDGTLASRFAQPPLKDHVFAKTGTLGEARTLSGYLECASGRTVIFSIMVGNHLPGSDADRVVMDKIVATIVAAE